MPDPQTEGDTAGAPRRTPAARRAVRLLVAITGLAGLALTWPIYPLVSHYRPTVLGLPLSFAWVILWLLAVFAALVHAFRKQHPSGASGDGGEAP